MSARAVVTILTSAVGLGVYIPALLIERKLRSRQVIVDVEVIEGYYTPSYQQSHLAIRDAHHASFALAQLAHRMARGIEHCLDKARVEALLARWHQEDRRYFIVWSGFWLPLLERYREVQRGKRLEVDHCRIDAVVSASFKVHTEIESAGHEVWLWNWAQRRIQHEVAVTDAPPIPFAAREDRLVVHGGGWGIGTYGMAVPELARTPYALDVVIHHLSEAQLTRIDDRAYLLHPAWNAWDRDTAGVLAFPPMQELIDRTVVRVLRNADYHSMHDVIRASKAIVSKPGGCTLIDSLAAATPVVLLQPFGYAEDSNATIWKHLGFGISYTAWRETGYDEAVLARLHANILRRTRGIGYVEAYLDQLLETSR